MNMNLDPNQPFQTLVTKLARARTLHPWLQVTLHHGYAIMLEELDEFWEQVKLKRTARDPRQMLQKLIQISAMAQRTAEDIVMPLVRNQIALDEASRPPRPEEIEAAQRPIEEPTPEEIRQAFEGSVQNVTWHLDTSTL